jgi:thiamine-phosphate pyrophosphorylase
MRLKGLYAITPEHPDPRRPLAEQVEQAILGGARVIQYRDKSADRQHRLDEARALRAVCRRHDVLLIINDDIELAAAVDADGIHLGRDDPAPAAARERLGTDALIGVSCYNQLENAQHARELGADYVAFGRFFPSASKPGAVPADIRLLHQARATLHLPIVAIGGITPQNGGPLVTAGADMLAVIDALFGSKLGSADIRAAAQAFVQLFPKEEPQ